jgi:outer membrane protein TolC
MKLRLITTIFSALMLLVVQMNAQQAKPAETLSLSLKQAQDYAIQNSAGSKNSALDMEIAKKKIWETTAIGLPQINAQANYQHLFKVPELSLGGSTFLATDLPAGTPITADDINNKSVYLGYTPGAPIPLGVKNNTTLDITVSQLIFSGSYIVGLQASKVYYQYTQYGKQKTEIDLKESVANLYASALLVVNNRDVMQKSLENSRKTLSDMKQMLAQGFVESTDVDQLEFVTLTLQNGVSSLNRDLDFAILNLKFILGMPFTDNLILTDKLESIAESIKLESLMATPFNIDNNLDYQMMLNAEAISNLNLKLEKSTYLPSISAVYRHEEMLNQPEFNFNPKDVVQVAMTIPIFSSGMRNVKVQQRQMELQKVVNNKNNLTNALQLNYVNARNKLTQAYETYQVDLKNIELTKRIYEKTQVKFKEGIATSRQITDDLNQYLSAQRNLYVSIFGLFTAKNTLDKLNNNL